MFRWCSYCQNLIGETEPLNDYRISHGICVKCNQDAKVQTSKNNFHRARTIFDLLEKARVDGNVDACGTKIDQLLGFSLKPSDIIVGILQPALYRIGELWEQGEITAAEEHRFTEFALGLIDRLTFPPPPSLPPTDPTGQPSRKPSRSRPAHPAVSFLGARHSLYTYPD